MRNFGGLEWFALYVCNVVYPFSDREADVLEIRGVGQGFGIWGQADGLCTYYEAFHIVYFVYETR